MTKDRITARSVNSTGYPKCDEYGPRGDPMQDRPTTDKQCTESCCELRDALGKILRNIKGGAVSTGWIESFIEEILKEKP